MLYFKWHASLHNLKQQFLCIQCYLSSNSNCSEGRSVLYTLKIFISSIENKSSCRESSNLCNSFGRCKWQSVIWSWKFTLLKWMCITMPKYWWEVLMMLLSSCLQVKRLEACELLDSNIISVKYFYLSVRIQYLNVYACISFDNYHSANHGYLGSISLISVVC